MNRRSLLLTLFVVAAACGFALEFFWVTRFDPLGAKLGLEVSRHDAIAAARQFAATLDAVPRAQAYVKLDGNDDLERYYPAADITSQQRSAIEEWTPAISYLVILLDPQWKNRLEVRISRRGRVLGFRQLDIEGNQSLDDVSARALAESTIRRRFGKESTALQYGGAKPVQRQTRRDLAFQWSRQVLPHLSIDAIIEVAGNRVVAEDVRARIDPQFMQQHIKSASRANVFLGIMIWVLALIVALYAMFRYVVRVREQEVPHARVLLLLAVFLAASISGLLVFSDDSLFEALRNQQVRPLGKASVAMPMAIALGIFALAMAISWALAKATCANDFPGNSPPLMRF